MIPAWLLPLGIVIVLLFAVAPVLFIAEIIALNRLCDWLDEHGWFSR